MIRIRIIALLILISTLAIFGAAQSDMTWHFPAANRYASAHGRRAWTGGYANQELEIWAGALQIASNVRPEFRREIALFLPLETGSSTCIGSLSRNDPATLIIKRTRHDSYVSE